jgi:DNA-binding transcriptional LysR family regulator
MELQQIRYVIAVAQYRSFTKAADILAVSASTLSEQVRRLEEELGVQLFSRTTRHVELTIPGHTFLNHASQIMTDFSTLREAVRRVEAEPQGIITLDIPLGASAPQFWRVLRLVRRLRTRDAHVSLSRVDVRRVRKMRRRTDGWSQLEGAQPGQHPFLSSAETVRRGLDLHGRRAGAPRLHPAGHARTRTAA